MSCAMIPYCQTKEHFGIFIFVSSRKWKGVEQMTEKDYIKQIKEMAELLGKADLKFLKQIYTMMHHYIKKRRS